MREGIRVEEMVVMYRVYVFRTPYSIGGVPHTHPLLPCYIVHSTLFPPTDDTRALAQTVSRYTRCTIKKLEE
jgi:hypothetical protein